MKKFSCILVAVVMMIYACEKVACTRPVGGATPSKEAAAGGVKPDTTESATWKQERGWQGYTWKQGIGCSTCEEVYVVREEGETLQTISEKCHAPFILLDNPHVQDTDDISTGSVLLIASTRPRC